ncbi:MAG: Gfo/Idh/MocA family oxidoreductase [Candidatus Latescibacterota bacterium]
MADRKYRVAVVGGAGTWGRHYLRTYVEHPQCQVVGLVDRAQERRQRFAARYGVAATYDTVEELLAVTVPDIVSAVVPVSQNYPVVRACAEAGVRVVSCEKPISAVLSEADAMVEVCRQHGTLLACAQAAWATPYQRQAMEWIQAGNIGRLTGAAIPGGLPVEVSGGGCVQLAALRILTGMEVEWVEGWELPAVAGYVAPGTPAVEADVPAYGRLGLSGGIACEIPAPSDESHMSTFISVTGENGQAWLSRPRPALIQGTGARSTPVFPDFLQESGDDFFGGTIQRLLDAFESGQEPLSSGDDYRHALQTAIAIKLSAASGHQRIALPLPDRGHRLLPHPYRLFGGDVAGWQSIGYTGPPQVPMELRAIASIEELSAVPWRDVQRLLRAVEPRDVALVLADGAEMNRKRALHALPDPVRARVQEEMEQLGTPPPEEVEAAKRRILEIARRL